MSESKHTPGPWEAFICDDGGQWSGWPLSIGTDDPERTVCRPGGFYPYEWDRGVSQREAVANAHLIAAAPDMLDALKSIRDANGENKHFSAESMTTINAAIAKATGAQS